MAIFRKNIFMFIEPNRSSKTIPHHVGWIEVICGSMFSGKTEELIRRLNRAKIARQKVEIFKPALDKRYHEADIVSHNENSIRSTPVNTAEEILLFAGECEVVGIDEAQFLDNSLVDVCNKLASIGKRVIVAGLDMDFLGQPFGCLPQLMAVAEYVTKVHAVCMVCGEVAQYSYRTDTTSKDKILLGETDRYEARCRRCYNLGTEA
jgi:thymidine kinase